MTAVQSSSNKTANRTLHINEGSQDLLNKLEAVRLVCKVSGCAQRYLSHDALTPYMHEFLVMPCRTHWPEDANFAVCCAVPVDAEGVTIIAKPAGRPGEAAAKFSGKSNW